jgi:hypothetical protein
VTYRNQQLICYFDGAKVFETADVAGDLRDWSSTHLLIGDEWQGGRDWTGTLEGVAMYNRVMSPSEARRHAEYYLQLISLRESVPQIEVAAELVERSQTAMPGANSPSLLAVSKYKVAEVLRGELEEGEILVIDWAYLNGEPQPALAAKPGDRVQLVLEHVEHNPQLGTVPTANDFELPAERAHYYAVRRTEK